jgi:GrpB-like predicted nucleotidyltransferase (UPF0157 family)
MAIGVKNLKVGEKCIKPLKQLGYEYKHDAGIKGRHFFAKGSEMYRTHYIHIEKINGKLWENHIFFRDYLRSHKEVINEYNELKQKLAEKYKDDRDTYTIKKVPFMRKIMKRIKKEGFKP